MFGPIQFGGLASGLDTAAIIDALLQVSRTPITFLEQDRTLEQSRSSLVGNLETLVKGLRDKAEKLSKPDGFLAFKGVAAIEGVVDLTVTGSASAGTHTLTVNALASADRYAFEGVADSDTTQLGAGNVTFTYDGQAYDVAIDGGSSTLQQIAAAINTAAGEAVTASVVNTGAASSPSYQLVLTGKESGADFAIDSLSVTGSLGSTLVAPADVDDYHITTASNAEIELDGLMIQRSSNEFNDVLEGVEMSIQAVDLSSPQTTTFTVSADTDAIKANLQEFVDSYNAVVDFLNQQSSYDQESGTGGDLFGDSVLSSVRRITHDPLFQVDISSVVGDTLGYSTLGLLGIDLGTDGRLTIDETKLDQKMADNLDAFSDFFTDSDGFDNGGAAKNTPGYYTDTTADSGAFAKLFRSIDQAVKSVTLDGDPDDPSDNLLIKGLFGRRKETFKSNIDRINKQIDALELRLEDYEESLVLRFSALEELMAGLNSQSSFLNSLNL